MSKSVLTAVLTETRKLANRAFQAKIKTEWEALGLKQGKYASDIFRKELNTRAIHSVSRKNVLIFMLEFLADQGMDSRLAKNMAKTYFDTLNRICSDLFRMGSTIFFLKDNKLTPSAKAAVYDLYTKKRSNISETKGLFNIINSAKPRADLYEEAKNRFEATNLVLLATPGLSEELKQFIAQKVDVGHVVSNISYYSNIAVVSGLKKAVEIKDNTTIAKLYSSLEDDKIRQLIKQEFISQLAEEGSKVSNIDRLFEYVFDSQIKLFREFSSSGSLKGRVNLKFSEGNTGISLANAIKNITNNASVSVAPQNSRINSEIGSTIEKQVISALPKLYTAMLNIVDKQLADVDVTSLQGSKSFRDLALDSISDIIVFGKNKQPRKTESTVDIKSKGSLPKFKPLVSKLLKPNNLATVISEKTTKSRLRSVSGSFQSVTNLQGLIDARLQEVIRKNMAPPALTYQTGRFVESVKLNSVQFDNRQNALTAFLSYMKYPYATFEVGGKQGNVDKSPYALIDRSVREIAAQLTKSRMRTVIV
jgi:hypothetical protein